MKAKSGPFSKNKKWGTQKGFSAQRPHGALLGYSFCGPELSICAQGSVQHYNVCPMRAKSLSFLFSADYPFVDERR